MVEGKRERGRNQIYLFDNIKQGKCQTKLNIHNSPRSEWLVKPIAFKETWWNLLHNSVGIWNILWNPEIGSDLELTNLVRTYIHTVRLDTNPPPQKMDQDRTGLRRHKPFADWVSHIHISKCASLDVFRAFIKVGGVDVKAVSVKIRPDCRILDSFESKTYMS